MSNVWAELGYLWACTAWDEASGNLSFETESMRRGGYGRWLGVRLCVKSRSET